MSGLEALVPLIYHEKQQSGSMLCAQHALNSLLQGPYFSPADLSEIAHKLDVLEEQYNTESEHGDSKNMDDTGFFSVQVIEDALEVWGLNLLRWRNSSMQSHQDHPETQLAFILNLEQHWFSLRRFGPVSGDIQKDASRSHWFNLNSFLPAPEWVSKVYLGMVLQQAETEGYSVFVITQKDASNLHALARAEADDIAATLPEPQSMTRLTSSRATSRDPESSTAIHQAPANSASANPVQHALDHDDVDGIDDEDYELQAVLQASLVSQEGYASPLYGLDVSEPSISSPPPLTAATTSTANRRSSQGPGEPDHVNSDPVAASMERNRVRLQRMREEQEYAQRELWSSNGLTFEERAVQEARQQRRRERQEQEEEELRRAIAESETMAQKRDEHQEYSNSSDSPTFHENIIPSTSSGRPDQEFRNYDDEDAELQAALKASLENVPPEWQQSVAFSPAPSPSKPQAPPHAQKSNSGTSDRKIVGDSRDGMDVDGDTDEWVSESEMSVDDSASKKETNSAPEEQNSPPSLDEIRKARLARFGS